MHSEPTANALLSTLGFNVDITRHVKNLRLDIEEDFDVDELRKEWRSYFEGYRTHLSYVFDDLVTEGRDEEGRFLLVKAGVLEEKRKLIERIGPWNFGDLGNEGRREVRALGIFSSWIRNTDLKEWGNNKLAYRLDDKEPRVYHIHHDLGHSFGGMLPEKLNAFSWNWARKRLTGDLRLDSYSAQPNRLRDDITWADARWMGRLIGQLSRGQIREAVDYGGWPQPAAALLTEKLIARRNDMMESLELVGEPTPSGPIALMPVERELTTPDGAVVDGVLVQDRFPETPVALANYWEALLRPVLDKALLAVVATLQSSVGQVVEIVFDDRSVGLPEGLVVEILVQVRRDVEANPDPDSFDDYFLARDQLRLGFRLGGGFVGRGEGTIWRQYTMLQPFGTEEAARFARGTIVDLLLPLKVRRAEVPEKYVLMRETFMDARVRVISDDLSGGALPAGAEVSFGRSRTSRDVISRVGDRVRVFEDVTYGDEAAYRAFAKAVFVRIPLLVGAGTRGTVDGTLFVLDDAFAEGGDERERAEAALQRMLRTGDASTLAEIAPARPITSRFRERSRWAGVFNIIETSRWNRVDDVSIDDENGKPRSFTQYAGEIFEGWTFLDFGEHSSARMHAVVPDDEDEKAALELHFFVDDLDVWEQELAGGYLPFANRLAHPLREKSPARAHTLIGEDRLLPLTPSLHGYGERWGHLRFEASMGFSEKGVDAVATLEEGELWAALADDPQLPAHEIRRAERILSIRNPVERRVQLRRLPSHVRRVAGAAHHTLRKLRAARESSNRSERFRHVVDALEIAVFRTGDTWDPAVLSALRRAAGPKHISVRAKIAPPPWRENTLVGDVPLRGSTHEKRKRPPYRPVLFNPRTPIDEYRMLDRIGDAARGTRPQARRKKKRERPNPLDVISGDAEPPSETPESTDRDAGPNEGRPQSSPAPE